MLSETSSGRAEVNDYGAVPESAQHYLDRGVSLEYSRREVSMVPILAELSVDLSRYRHALDVLHTLLKRLRIDLTY